MLDESLLFVFAIIPIFEDAKRIDPSKILVRDPSIRPKKIEITKGIKHNIL